MDPYGGGMSSPMGGSPEPAKKPAQKPVNPDEPELHAAPGASDEVLGSGSEPTLPERPLAMSPRVAASIGTDTDLENQERGRREEETKRSFYGVVYTEESGGYGFTTTLPPLWVNRTQPSRTNPAVTDRATVAGGLYYNRRSAERADDVLFPLFFNLRDRIEGSRTTVLGPFANRSTKTESDTWLAPLFFHGKRPDGGYTLIPPLLTYDHLDKEGGTTIVGPAFCSFSGGTSCDTRTSTDIDFGIAPLYFYGQNRWHNYELIPPLFHYYGYDDRDLSWVNVWGPYYREHDQKRDLLHVMPIYWSLEKQNGGRYTTVFPLFHYGRENGGYTLANPLFLLARGEKGESTFVTWGYARYRGRTSLDMVTPLYWQYEDPDINLTERLLFPLYYDRVSPRESTHVYFPFYGKSTRYGISDTTWVTPFFQHTHDLTGWSTNIHPLLYLGRNGRATHTVVAPFFYDFAGTESRATVGFPVFWRFTDLDGTAQLVGNVYYGEKRVHGGTDWQLHIFPLFSYGESPRGHFWNVLFGLAGFTREGAEARVRALWIPINVGEKPVEQMPVEGPTP